MVGNACGLKDAGRVEAREGDVPEIVVQTEESQLTEEGRLEVATRKEFPFRRNGMSKRIWKEVEQLIYSDFSF